MEGALHGCVVRAAAVVRQEHNSNGSVLLSFDAYLMAPAAGEVGTIAVAVQDGSGPWNATQNVSLPTTGENKATVQVCPGLLCAALPHHCTPVGVLSCRTAGKPMLQGMFLASCISTALLQS